MGTLTLRQSLKFCQAELAAHVYQNNFQKIFKISAISAGAVLLLGVVMFNLQNPVVLRSDLNKTSVALAAGLDIPISSSPTMLGINISNNGAIFVRGARVVSISGTTITALVSWGLADFTWKVETSGLTKFLNHQGKKQTISDIKVGDIVTVTGKLTGDNNQFVINAEFVRN